MATPPLVSFRIVEGAVPSTLAGVVRSIAGYEEATFGRFRRQELSGASVVLIFEAATPLRIEQNDNQWHRYDGFIAPITARSSLTEHDGFQAGVEVRLAAGRSQEILGAPLRALGPSLVSARDLFGPQPLFDQLRNTESLEARVAVVTRWLLDRQGRSADPRVVHACEALDRSGGALPIGELQRRLVLSERHLHRIFREATGLGPKQYARRVRLDRLADQLKGTASPRWAELAATLGFYDQAHLARDVRSLWDLTPSELHRVIGPA
ncbi:MAG: helix-turn-helix transcriptional regulator [Myxococcota bacterium]